MLLTPVSLGGAAAEFGEFGPIQQHPEQG